MNLLEIENLSVDFSGFMAVDDFNLTIGEGEVVGIVGESGSGKECCPACADGTDPLSR